MRRTGHRMARRFRHAATASLGRPSARPRRAPRQRSRAGPASGRETPVGGRCGPADVAERITCRISHARSPVRLVSFLLLGISSVDAVAASLTEQRRLYDQAKAALARNGAPTPLARRPARLPAGTLPGYNELTASADHRQQGRSSASSAEHGDLPQIGLAETALAAPADRPRRLEDLRQLHYDRAGFAELDCLYGRCQLGHGQKAKATPPANACGWSASRSRLPATPVRHSGENENQLTEGLETPQAGRRALLYRPRLAPRAAPADPRQPGRADGQRGAEPARLSQTGRFSQRDHATADVVGLGLHAAWRGRTKKA